jgi:hypothetical protein
MRIQGKIAQGGTNTTTEKNLFFLRHTFFVKKIYFGGRLPFKKKSKVEKWVFILLLGL